VPLSQEMLLFPVVCQLSVGGLPKVSGAKVLSGGHLRCVSSRPLQLLVHPPFAAHPDLCQLQLIPRRSTFTTQASLYRRNILR